MAKLVIEKNNKFISNSYRETENPNYLFQRSKTELSVPDICFINASIAEELSQIDT